MGFSVNGLPLHPLLVHAVIALVPIAAIAVLLHALWPAARRRLGVVTPLAGLALVIVVPITVLAGRDLRAKVGPLPQVDRHAQLGEMLLPWAIALLIVGVLEWVWFRRRDRRRTSGLGGTVITATLAVAAIGVASGALVLIVLIGEAGARAVWGR